ncbi:hypothetical protein M6D81_11335 [Paenibacillus sp. J5C_2022]|uniref:hypothetical protein n=1 Tax=Paenibacillus sp. J5C2022 TaxID=2977129 RepID=UPI0021D0C668|nr:hypothetical protein [Paenibacillus sp. J5C2022]MCU6709299.1 hypothetical protein [Paenibacillus sp. J5C2022]
MNGLSETGYNAKVADYIGNPGRLLLTLADMAEGNEKLRRVWLANYCRVTDERKRRNQMFN